MPRHERPLPLDIRRFTYWNLTIAGRDRTRREGLPSDEANAESHARR
jgi:hypothetical protein